MLITTSVPEIINRVFRIKVYVIRVLEEVFGENYNRFYSDWKYQQYEECCSDEDDSKANSVIVVPETDLSVDVTEEDIHRLQRKFQTKLLVKNRVSRQGPWIVAKPTLRRRFFSRNVFWGQDCICKTATQKAEKMVSVISIQK